MVVDEECDRGCTSLAGSRIRRANNFRPLVEAPMPVGDARCRCRLLAKSSPLDDGDATVTCSGRMTTSEDDLLGTRSSGRSRARADLMRLFTSLRACGAWFVCDGARGVLFVSAGDQHDSSTGSDAPATRRAMTPTWTRGRTGSLRSPGRSPTAVRGGSRIPRAP